MGKVLDAVVRCMAGSKMFQEFDAVVIASGHYHACRIPEIPGLAKWKVHWPHRIQHSKSYRNPRSFRGQVGTTAYLSSGGVSFGQCTQC